MKTATTFIAWFVLVTVSIIALDAIAVDTPWWHRLSILLPPYLAGAIAWSIRK